MQQEAGQEVELEPRLEKELEGALPGVPFSSTIQGSRSSDNIYHCVGREGGLSVVEEESWEAEFSTSGLFPDPADFSLSNLPDQGTKPAKQKPRGKYFLKCVW